VQLAVNRGFSGGNNVGIRAVLADPAVTHVCLLNSDVIVPHRWLDDLLASGHDIVSPVTNKAESEQCVPVDYDLLLPDCLDEQREALREGVFDTVDGFARRRRLAFGGNVVDEDATFFCVLLARAAVERIGDLDETFFPGGYEDDDYCLRARAAGLPVHLDRGVFVHHWGSASFGEIDPGYFGANAARNRAHLEQKHGITWRIRPEKPFVSYAQDMAFALAGRGDVAQQQLLGDLCGRVLTKLLAHYQSEFRNLRQLGAATGEPLPEPLAREVAGAAAHGDLEPRWRRLCAAALARSSRRAGAADPPVPWPAAMLEFAAAVHAVVSANFAIHRHLTARATADGTPAPALQQPLWRRLWTLLRWGLPFLLRLRGIVFLGGYPYPAREDDGYFQRIRAIDRLFEDRWRIYFDPDPLPGTNRWFDLPAPRTLVLRPVGGPLRVRLVVLITWLCVLRCRAVYFHSVLRMQDHGLGRLMRLPCVRKILDVHGVVPEEFRMHDDFYHATLFDRHEQLAVRRATRLVVVTEAMRAYFVQKYRDRLRGEVIVLPSFPGLSLDRGDKPDAAGGPIVVYAGGLHRWQQIPKMVDAIARTHETCQHRVYVTEPDTLLAMLPEHVRAGGNVVVDRKSHAELLECYRECHFGFVLRTDSVVNRVACPTKVVEYLAMGIVPIVDSERIGDFADLGFRYVRLDDFLAGKLPDPAAREAMARENFAVYARLSGQREGGAARLQQAFARGPRPGGLLERALWRIGKLLPPETHRGRLARRVYRALCGRPAVAAAVSTMPEIAPCDVLVQVDAFLAGGLENAVLDLNEAFQAAGLRVGMVVLGEPGAAVARARAQGVPVCTARYSDEVYRHLLRTAAPKVVMSHYSIAGAALCREAGIPLVQVIHNVYLWLHGAELAAMKASAAHTAMFVAASDFARDFSVRRLGVPADRCTVIPYGIDVRRFRECDVAGERQRLRAGLGIAPDDFVFLNVGAMNHQKNHLSQLRAFQACAAACPRARLAIVGPIYEHELLRECRSFVGRHGLGDRVVFVGGVGDMRPYYAMADALVHSAFFEGGPLALLEALAANLPVVTVATGLAVHFAACRGVATVSPHFDVADYHGRLVEMRASPDTEAAMAAAMERVYRDPVRPDLPDAVVEGFDRANAYRAYVQLVQNLALGRPPSWACGLRTWSERFAATG
jgi:glycosyltransferase involved in cell wall biosynthesis